MILLKRKPKKKLIYTQLTKCIPIEIQKSKNFSISQLPFFDRE